VEPGKAGSLSCGKQPPEQDSDCRNLESGKRLMNITKEVVQAEKRKAGTCCPAFTSPTTN